MKFIINVLIFLALIGFCFYWFNDSNPDKNDPSKIPYVGSVFGAISEKYAEARFYLDSGQGNVWDFLQNTEKVRQITDKFREIYEIGQAPSQP